MQPPRATSRKPLEGLYMSDKSTNTFELLDSIGKIITKVIAEEGLLLPGTVDELLRAKDQINKLKNRFSNED